MKKKKREIDEGMKIEGWKVNMVKEGMEEGKIIEKEEVKVMEGDKEEKMEERVMKEEKRIYKIEIKKFEDGEKD